MAGLEKAVHGISAVDHTKLPCEQRESLGFVVTLHFFLLPVHLGLLLESCILIPIILTLGIDLWLTPSMSFFPSVKRIRITCFQSFLQFLTSSNVFLLVVEVEQEYLSEVRG